MMPKNEPNTDSPYDMGYDSVIKTTKTTDCHFSLFSTQAKMKAWEQGVRDAKKETKNDTKTIAT